jgi:hypothetical protein
MPRRALATSARAGRGKETALIGISLVDDGRSRPPKAPRHGTCRPSTPAWPHPGGALRLRPDGRVLHRLRLGAREFLNSARPVEARGPDGRGGASQRAGNPRGMSARPASTSDAMWRAPAREVEATLRIVNTPRARLPGTCAPSGCRRSSGGLGRPADRRSLHRRDVAALAAEVTQPRSEGFGHALPAAATALICTWAPFQRKATP